MTGFVFGFNHLKTGNHDLQTERRILLQKPAKQKSTFSLAAPLAKTVLLAADFTQWGQSPISRKKLKSGLWKATIFLSPGTYEYRFLMDGRWKDDPQC